MNVFLKLITQVYRYLLRLYPRSMQEEFTEEMLSDFSDLAIDASNKGNFSLFIFCMRELFAFPVNLVRIYEMESRMLKALRLQPVNYGLRGAIGYGIGFASVTFLGRWVSLILFAALDPMLQSYTIWYWETFRNERFIWLFNNFVTLLSYALTAVLFGFLFALLAGDSRKRGSYLLAGSLAWFIPNVLSSILSNSFGWSFYLNESQMNILVKLLLVLEGLFYSAALVIADNNQKESFRRLTIVAILLSLGAYFYIKILFYFWLEVTELFFPALIVLLLLLIGSIFLISMKNDRKSSWLIGVGAVIYPILFSSVFQIIYNFPPVLVRAGGIPNQNIIDLTLNHAVTEGILGICFGLLLGLILGFQKKSNSTRLVT
jgi:hypothetical protein